jgi:hypothetical protein
LEKQTMNLLTHFRKITILGFVLAGPVLLFSVQALFADGIASRYPNDVGIENDPEVILADGFESYTSPSQLSGKWDEAGTQSSLRIATEPGNYVGGHKSLEMNLPIGTGAWGNGLTKKISPKEPVLFVRAYTKFDPGFSLSGSTHNGITLSGNYPGPGTPPPRDGSGFFLFHVQNFKDSNPRTGTEQPGYTFVYSYWPFQYGNWGDWWYPNGWDIGFGWGLWVTQPANYPDWVPYPNWQPIRGVWYCYEFMVRVNDLGKRNGVVAFWINGQLRGRWTDLFIRSVDDLKIDTVKVALYGQRNGQVNKKWYDNVVIARNYIGPISPTGPPVAITKPANYIASFSARLNGSVDPHGLTTTVYFQYGTTTSYGLTTAIQSKTGNTYQNVVATIGGLTASTTYHFRIVAINSNGTRYGSDRTFTTLRPTGPPVAITKPATNVASSSATLNGSVDPHGLTTNVHFQYGRTTSYGHTTANQTKTGNAYQNVAANISGLSANTRYHFRIVGTNSAGTRYGSDRTFTTQ